jgi:hypothetical protein
MNHLAQAGAPQPERTCLKLLATRLTAALALVLSACGGGSGSDPVTVNGAVPVVYARRANTLPLEPLHGGAAWRPGGDLMLRTLASPSAPEINLTAVFTQGMGDVADPAVSYDGKRVAFAMNCPTTNTSLIGTVPACTGHWNIWEYDTTAGGLANGSFRRITNSVSDDVAPAYLPAGAGFVFSSNRQTTSAANQALGQSYFALDEYEREQVFNLHTMDLAGAHVTQISFNQSHDRNPVVRPNGDIMFSRWEHVGDRNRFSVFTVKPDGTGMFVLYGAHAPGNSFLHPHDMDPAGRFPGFIASDLMPLDQPGAAQTGHSGGALMFVDAAHYPDNAVPANATIPASGGQVQATSQTLNIDRGFSLYGRVTTPTPLWDGSDRVLLSWTPCEVSRAGTVVPCATLSSAEIARLSDPARLLTAIQADSLQDNVPPSFAVYMFDPAAQTWLLVAAPPAGFALTSPVALMPRAEPAAFQAQVSDPVLAASNFGTISVRSVYDTDLLGRMGPPVLASADLAAGCSSALAQKVPTDPLDTRALVADLLQLKDPSQPAYGCTPVRFVRAVRAVAPPQGTTGLRQAIGITNFEPQQILGYAVVEPDGSFELTVPANTPIGFSVLDAQGRAFQVHTNWIQVRPGERRTCDGCHSPRPPGSAQVATIAPLNTGTVLNTLSPALNPALAALHQTGDTMAMTHARADASVKQLQPDMHFADVWALVAGSTPNAANAPRAAVDLTYGGLQTTAVPVNGIINYPDHIQPLWNLVRSTPAGNYSCVSCHSNPNGLNLAATVAGTGRLASYESLMTGAPQLDPVTGQPVLTVIDQVQVVATLPPRVNVKADETDAIGMARKSPLAEVLSGQLLMVLPSTRALYPTSGSPVDHATLLNASEKRLLAEWIDLGGKYYNDPFAGASGVRSISGLSFASFQTQVYPVLLGTCAAGCHMARGTGSTIPPGTSFVDNKLVLTGDPQGDYNNTLTMISNACAPAGNYLLSYPSTVPHPAGAQNQTAAVLPAGSANYNAIAAWIQTGCTP